MADLVITASSVKPATVAGSPVRTKTFTAGATLTAGQPFYLDKANGNVAKPADADASAATAVVAGIALGGATTGQPFAGIIDGPLTLGSVVTAGKVYVQSATAGGIAPVADLTTSMRTTILGYGYSGTVLMVRINNTGIVN